VKGLEGVGAWGADLPPSPHALSMTLSFSSGALRLEGELVLPAGSTQAAVVCHPEAAAR